MTSTKENQKLDAKGFYDWLKAQNHTDKIAKDCVYRCNRIEKALDVSLNEAVLNKLSYIQLLSELKTYTESIAPTPTAHYALSGTLRYALRKYAYFVCGESALLYPMRYLQKQQNPEVFGKALLKDVTTT